MRSSGRAWGAWVASASMLMLAAAMYVHEQRESQRFAELSGRIDEVRLLQSKPRDSVKFAASPPTTNGELAEVVAARVLSTLANSCPRQSTSSPNHETGEAAEPTPARAPDPDRQRLLAQANEMTDRAIAAGVLRRSDVEELRFIFSRVGAGEERLELWKRVTNAINEQKLAVEDPAFILF